MLSISPITGTPNVQKGSAEAAQTRHHAAQVTSEQATPEQPAEAAPLIANPSLRYDLQLGLVVVEFFDAEGELATSVPTPRQLKAYESGLNVRSGPVPLPRDLPAGADQDGLAVVA